MTQKIGKKERTKRKIISTAIMLFDEYGIDNTSMEQILSVAEISKGTLYNHFSCKEEIISAFIENSFKDNQSICPDTLINLTKTKDKLVYVFSALIEGIERKRDLFEQYVVFRMKEMVSFSKYKESGFTYIAKHIITEGQKNNELRDDIPLSYLLDLFDFTFIEIIKQSTINKNENKSDLIDKFSDIFINSLKIER